MDVRIIWTSHDWADAVAALPVDGPLPCRTVLVPRERVAHVLRRELIRVGRTNVLAGTRFVPIAYAAVEVLRRAGIVFEPGEEALRPARLIALFRSDINLRHFPRDLLRERPGWDEAFARTLSDLEGAGFRPEDLESATASERLWDVATIWRALDESAGQSWTAQRILLEASRALEERPGVWPLQGPTLAFAVGSTTGAEARFARTIPGVALAFLAARPARERYLERMRALLGDDVGEALRSARAPRSNGTERNLLASFLFEPPWVLADESRPRSSGPDGTVDLEEHAGVEAEVEATADWAARQIAAGVALEEIGILIPTLDPIAGLVTDRLARLPWQGGSVPVYVAGGLPLAGFAAGARALAVLRALRTYLAGEVLAGMLPALRSAAADGRHLSHGAAMDLVWSLGTVGGNAAKPAGALEWSARARERETELENELERARAAEEAGGRAGRRAHDLERLLVDLRAIRPALDALVQVARGVVDGAVLAVLWPALRDFLGTWLLQPGEGPRVQALLDEQLASMASDTTCGTLASDDALRIIEETLVSTRVVTGRFGEPAVYIGTVREAVGLQFRAVRVVALSEGHLPSIAREDPVLPDALRETLSASDRQALRPSPPPTAADRALEDLHALDVVIRNAVDRVALSAPRVDVERSQREPSSVILEAAAALGRPNRITGERGATIPDVPSLRRDAFVPAREVATLFRHQRPLGEAAWQDGVSARAVGAPRRWREVRSLELERVARIWVPDTFGPMDGLLGAATAYLPVPGLSPEWPISPSALDALLGCPHAYLLGNVLGFDEPMAAPPQREIGQPYYGNLFHAVAANFYSRDGASFYARERTLAEWLGRADELVDHAFVEFLREYPLVGDAVRTQQRERLRRDIHELLAYDWEAAVTEGRRFIAVERVFGWPSAVELSFGGRSLFVRGRIDRIDVEGHRAVVRDLKTGRAHPRSGKERNPDPTLDLQIAVYGLVAQALAADWQIPEHVAAAYVYVGRGDSAERSYRNDFHELLEPLAQRWIDIASGLLTGRLFPRTPNEKDCSYCCFRPVCGPSAFQRAGELLAGADGVLADFTALKSARENEED